MKIALIPIDNRPVCYSLPKDIANIDEDLELILPDKKLLGGLTSYANIEGILHWIDKLEHIDAIVVSLDTVAHGGLIPSRRSNDSLEHIKLRLENFKTKCSQKNIGKIYAFSSIMRISNNNVNEEEKEYWNKYGTQIFEYSYNFHKEGLDVSEVPPEILNDYLVTRRRNFEINKIYLNWLEEGFFDTLVFSKDDCAEFGLNVLEAGVLEKIIKEKELTAFVKTGADEIPLSLFARAICDYNNTTPKIYTKFLAPEHKHLISKYEDISIEKSVKNQIELSGGICINNDEEDIVLLVNNFEEFQGEIVMGIKTPPFSGQFSLPKKPYIIADVRFANGADNLFIEKFFKKPINFDTFYGYSAWNTSANTLGSLICAAIVRFYAKKYNEEAFKKLQMIRFLDDWAYQANVRQALKQKNKKRNKERPDVRQLSKIINPFEQKLRKFFKIKQKIKYSFPWKRFFEIGIVIR